MTYKWQFQLIWKYKQVFIDALGMTLVLTIIACSLGTILGLFIALLKKSKKKYIQIPLRVYIDIIRAIPVLVLLIWMYYCIPIFTGLKIGSFTTAWLVLSINASPFIAEVIRSGIEAIPRGQSESAKVLGYTEYQIIFKIILPQAIKQMIPNLLNMYITMLKLSSLASVIAVNEIVHAGNILISSTYQPLEVYTTVALLYIMLVLLLSYFSQKLEKRLGTKKKFFGGFNVVSS